MKILSINVAPVRSLFPVDEAHPRSTVPTAYDKRPVAGAVCAERLGLDGDSQADLSVHGGADKAVYAYPFEHYAFWMQQRALALRRELPPLTFGAFAKTSPSKV